MRRDAIVISRMRCVGEDGASDPGLRHGLDTHSPAVHSKGQRDMLGRRILVVGGAAASAIVVVALVLAGAVLMLPAERIGAFAAARAEAMLERDVEVERFRIRLLPRPSVSLEGLTVAGPDSAAFASVRRIDLRPKLLPLLRRNVVIDEVVLDRPRLVVEVAADGTTNLPPLADAGGTDAAEGDRKSVV